MRSVLVAGMTCISLVALGTHDGNAQASATFRLTEQAINQGGRPLQGTSSASSGYRTSQEAIGEPITARALSGANFRLDASFVMRCAPPGEVRQLRFVTRADLAWDHDPSIGSYGVYRGALESMPSDFGSCVSGSITTNAWHDAPDPAIGHGFFYLVTARSRIGEEGTKGTGSSGSARPNPSPCP